MGAGLLGAMVLGARLLLLALDGATDILLGGFFFRRPRVMFEDALDSDEVT